MAWHLGGAFEENRLKFRDRFIIVGARHRPLRFGDSDLAAVAPDLLDGLDTPLRTLQTPPGSDPPENPVSYQS